MSTRSATARIRLILDGSIKNVLSNGDSASASIAYTLINKLLEDGVSADEISRALIMQRDLASGGTETIDIYDYATIDLGAGTGLDALGQALTMEEIVLFALVNIAGPGTIQLMATTPGNSVTWMPAQTVANGGGLREGGVFLRYEPDGAALGITDALSHLITVSANGGAASYVIIILGRHDDDESSSSSSSTSTSSSYSTASSRSSSSTSTSQSTVNSSSSSTSSVNSSSSSSSSTSSVNSSSSSLSTTSLSSSSSINSSSSSLSTSSSNQFSSSSLIAGGGLSEL